MNRNALKVRDAYPALQSISGRTQQPGISQRLFNQVDGHSLILAQRQG
ncbi:MAG: hypothetical protein CG441_564, partial [Methylococcaceae bacterium NSM2-1]